MALLVLTSFHHAAVAEDAKEPVQVEFEVQLGPGKTDTFVVEVIN